MYKTTGRAKPTKHARLICTLAMISAAIGIVIGLLTGNPLWIIFFLFPAVIYEIYRTQGVSTKWASWMMLGILLAEIALIAFNVSFDIAEFLGQETAYVGGETIRLGDIKTLGPALLAVVSMVLMLRTAGVYTKWLAGIIFVTSFALIFTLDPDQFGYLLQIAVQRIFRSL